MPMSKIIDGFFAAIAVDLAYVVQTNHIFPLFSFV